MGDTLKREFSLEPVDTGRREPQPPSHSIRFRKDVPAAKQFRKPGLDQGSKGMLAETMGE
jgi:hypothetical protein